MAIFPGLSGFVGDPGKVVFLQQAGRNTNPSRSITSGLA